MTETDIIFRLMVQIEGCERRGDLGLAAVMEAAIDNIQSLRTAACHVKEAVAAERETCARLCLNEGDLSGADLRPEYIEDRKVFAAQIASSIRVRGLE